MNKVLCFPNLLRSRQKKKKVENLERNTFVKVKGIIRPKNIYFCRDFVCFLDENGKFMKIRQQGNDIMPPISVDIKKYTTNSFSENKYHIILQSSYSIHIFCRKTMKLLFLLKNKSIENIVSIDANRVLFLTRGNNLYEIHLIKNKFTIRTVNNFKWENSFRVKNFSYFGNGIVFVGNVDGFMLFDIVKEKKIYKEYETAFRCVVGLECSTNFVIGMKQLIFYKKNKTMEYKKHVIPSSRKGKNYCHEVLKCLENDKVMTLLSSPETKMKLEIYDVFQKELLYQYDLNELKCLPLNIFLYTNFIICQSIQGYLLVLLNPFYMTNKKNLEMIVSASNKSEIDSPLAFFQNLDIVQYISDFLFF